MKVAVIGAGIAGVSAAYYCAKDGMSVDVYDREPYVGMRASYANGGQLSASNSEVWTTWANIIKGLKWMLKEDAPLLIRPSLDLDKMSFLFKFVLSTMKKDSDIRTLETIRLALANRRLMNTIVNTENITNFDYRTCGILHVYKTKKYLENALAVKSLYEGSGVEWDLKDKDQCLDIEPRLFHMKNLLGGIWTESDSVGDIHKFCCSLQDAMIKKYGTRFFFNHVINTIDELLPEYDKVIIANGSDACSLKIDNIQVYPVKGYSITIDNARGAPGVSLLDDEVKIVSSRLGNRLRIAGTAEFAGHNRDIVRSRITPLLKWVRDNFPSVVTEHYTPWACLRPMTPNMMPIVGQSQINKKVYYHCGHGHLGWTTSLATAKKLKNIICQ